MKFELALKKLHKGIEMHRANSRFTLKMEKDQLIRKTMNGAKTTARVASHDLLADDWTVFKPVAGTKVIRKPKKK